MVSVTQGQQGSKNIKWKFPERTIHKFSIPCHSQKCDEISHPLALSLEIMNHPFYCTGHSSCTISTPMIMGKGAVRIKLGFSTMCGFRHHWGSWNKFLWMGEELLYSVPGLRHVENNCYLIILICYYEIKSKSQNIRASCFCYSLDTFGNQI